jgi:hypothetical protein
MTVGELRKALTGLSDHMEVVVRAEDEDGNSYCGTPCEAAACDGCAGNDAGPFFAIDCMPEEEG